MNETTLTARIVRALEKQKVYVRKMHGGPYQQPGIPDLLCVVNGRAVGLEVKVEPNKATQVQEYEHKLIRRAGGVAEVVYSVDEALAVIKQVSQNGSVHNECNTKH